SLSSLRHHLHLHSFPTRRSSDLDANGRRHAGIIRIGCVVDSSAPSKLDFAAGSAARGVMPFVMNDQSLRVPLPNLIFISYNLRRSEEHTSELQSRGHLVCRLLLE